MPTHSDRKSRNFFNRKYHPATICFFSSHDPRGDLLDGDRDDQADIVIGNKYGPGRAEYSDLSFLF